KEAEKPQDPGRQERCAHHPGKSAFNFDLERRHHAWVLRHRHVRVRGRGIRSSAAANWNASGGRRLHRPRGQTFARWLRSQVRRTAKAPRSQPARRPIRTTAFRRACKGGAPPRQHGIIANRRLNGIQWRLRGSGQITQKSRRSCDTPALQFTKSAAHTLTSGPRETGPLGPPLGPPGFGLRGTVRLRAPGSFSGFGVTGPSTYSKPIFSWVVPSAAASSFTRTTRTWPPPLSLPNSTSSARGFLMCS